MADRWEEPTKRHPWVFVIDDDDDLREALAEVLANEGYMVQLAAGGEEALERLARFKPKMIILDLMMPGMTGHQFMLAKSLDPRIADIPIVVMSASDTELERTRPGVQRFRKPIDIDALLALVRHVAGPAADFTDEEAAAV